DIGVVVIGVLIHRVFIGVLVCRIVTFRIFAHGVVFHIVPIIPGVFLGRVAQFHIWFRRFLLLRLVIAAASREEGESSHAYETGVLLGSVRIGFLRHGLAPYVRSAFRSIGFSR